MIQDQIHEKILSKCNAVTDWYDKKRIGLKFPIYSSFDIRDSGWKVAPVDANIFPAGFNNICHVDRENAPEIMKSYLQDHYSKLKGPIGLLTEEHTGNSFYWENVASIQEILSSAGYESVVGIPSELDDKRNFTTAKGKEVIVTGSRNIDGEIFFGDQKLELIICNNDFSSQYEQWNDKVKTPINPPRELGWYQRRKHNFFNQYNLLAAEFAQLIGVHVDDLQLQTALFENFDVYDPDSLEALAKSVDEFLVRLSESYSRRKIDHKPFCFIKNNMGTYGLGVTQVHSGDDVRSWNNKARKKMQASKGGQEVNSVIIQEGIPTRFKDDEGATAEPCIYMIGEVLVGGFLRTHSSKNEEESLNSPGAVFKRLCMSDLEINQPGCPMENVYGWTSKLSALAIALEAKAAHVNFKGYTG